MRKPRIQEVLKRIYGKCLFCPEARYEALQCHRVVEGADGGKYRDGNVVILCSTHHSLVTAGLIKTHGIYIGQATRLVVHVTNEQGREEWLKMEPNMTNYCPLLEKSADMLKWSLVRAYANSKASVKDVIRVRVLYSKRKTFHRFDVRVSAKNSGLWSSCVECGVGAVGELSDFETEGYCSKVQKLVECITQEEVETVQ